MQCFNNTRSSLQYSMFNINKLKVIRWSKDNFHKSPKEGLLLCNFSRCSSYGWLWTVIQLLWDCGRRCCKVKVTKTSQRNLGAAQKLRWETTKYGPIFSLIIDVSYFVKFNWNIANVYRILIHICSNARISWSGSIKLSIWLKNPIVKW